MQVARIVQSNDMPRRWQFDAAWHISGAATYRMLVAVSATLTSGFDFPHEVSY